MRKGQGGDWKGTVTEERFKTGTEWKAGDRTGLESKGTVTTGNI